MVFFVSMTYNNNENNDNSSGKEGDEVKESVESFYKGLRDASPSDCRKLFNALGEMLKKESDSPFSRLVLDVQKTLLLYGVMKEDPSKDDLKKGDFGKVNVNIRVKKTNRGLFYVLTGREAKDEIAVFPGFLQAALVTRYLSGGNMRPEDAANALAAISEYDIIQEEAGAE